MIILASAHGTKRCTGHRSKQDEYIAGVARAAGVQARASEATLRLPLIDLPFRWYFSNMEPCGQLWTTRGDSLCPSIRAGDQPEC